MGIFHIPKKSGLFTLSGGYGWINLDGGSDIGGYEDYTKPLVLQMHLMIGLMVSFL